MANLQHYIYHKLQNKPIMLKLKVRKQGGEGRKEGRMGGFHTCIFFDMHKCGALTFTTWWMKTHCDTV